jgi:hypothetical protein
MVDKRLQPEANRPCARFPTPFCGLSPISSCDIYVWVGLGHPGKGMHDSVGRICNVCQTPKAIVLHLERWLGFCMKPYCMESLRMLQHLLNTPETFTPGLSQAALMATGQAMALHPHISM